MSHRNGARLGAFLFAVFSIMVPSRAEVTPLLTFEDVFGPCPDIGFTLGPGNPTIQGVLFETSDPNTYNYGKLGETNITPFNSDWFTFFTDDAGATITFPEPIYWVSFNTGTRDAWTGMVFKLFSEGVEYQTFAVTWSELRTVTQTFPHAVTSIHFTYVDGPTSLLGMDNLQYSTVPEPASAGLLAALAGMGIGRRRRR